MTETIPVLVKELADNEEFQPIAARIKNLSTLSATLQSNLLNENAAADTTPTIDVDVENVANFSDLTSITPQFERNDDEATSKNIYGSKQNIILFQDVNIGSQSTDRGGGAGAVQTVTAKLCRFPKLEECAHFHYERVQLGALSVCLVNDKLELFNTSFTAQSGIGAAAPTAGAGGVGDVCCTSNLNSNNLGTISLHSYNASNTWFLIKVSSQQTEAFFIKRSLDNIKMLDEMLHRCVYDRKISGLKNFKNLEFTNDADMEYAVSNYLERFSKIASDSLTCGTILTWLQLDNKGRRLPLADDDTMRSINTPAVGAAYGVRRYQAQASDEISIELGDMISVIDMPTPAESVWWRGKKSNWQKSHYEVGFFPQSCVATIGDKVPRYIPLPAPLVGQVDVSPTKPVLRKHGKLIAFFRSFILSRPSRRRLKQSGIYRERVFSCDLSEHLLNSGQEIPLVLKSCAEFIEAHGIVDGIYRLSGITSNIQKLRQAFDEERVPDLGNPEMRQDIHAVSSLLKMYFRELPNPLCTYQLYDNFVEAIQTKSNAKERLRLMKETVIKLPPPHYRTLRYLAKHLHRISQFSERTGMTDKNLAIVWAPNLLRSPTLEAGGVAALQGVGVQAVVTEYLIRHSQKIFNDLDKPITNAQCSNSSNSSSVRSNVDLPGSVISEMRLDSLTDCESLLVKQREFDQSTIMQDRPKSMTACGPKLISLEEAQERQSRLESGNDLRPAIPISIASNIAGSYIEVGGGPASLPDKYHTVLSVPRSWQKRKTHSWKSLFMRNQRVVVVSGGHSASGGVVVGGNNTQLNLKTHEVTNITCSENALRATPKEIVALSFAETHASNANKLCMEKKTKSTEFLESIKSTVDNAYNKGSDLYLRSSSIDSLRTAGHSRSVSHDSYFDLLQSPLHGHITTTSPSRELTELGLNFDREEPEMRIFSESESLVSSPRVGKENLPPSTANYVYLNSRRIIRARPEEFISQTNSINPSPKKQPRLNMLLSPKVTLNDNQKESLEMPGTNNLLLTDELNYSKRYKFEDQFPDIQYIDCNTPEHTINANSKCEPMPLQSKLTSPKNGYKTEIIYEPININNNNNKAGPRNMQKSSSPPSIYKRYSCPSLQLLDAKRQEDNANDVNETATARERFSYPIMLERTIDKTNNPLKVLDQKERKILGNQSKTKTARYSYCGNNDSMNLSFMRSNSSDSSKAFKTHDFETTTTTLGVSKTSMTPSSTAQSPRYTLLLGGETSSENSSAVNTPQYDGEIILTTPLLPTELKTPTSPPPPPPPPPQPLPLPPQPLELSMPHLAIDKDALKKELSLDLTPVFNQLPEMSIYNQFVTDKNLNQKRQQQQHQQKLLQLTLSPNNSILTDNTSASVTPSDFDYQSLQRQTSVNSLLDILDDEGGNSLNTNNKESPMSTCCLISPMQKSTISITYNLRSQLKSKDDDHYGDDDYLKQEKTITTPTSAKFDENMVYEQLKIFRNSVSEINEIFQQNSPLKHDNDDGVGVGNNNMLVKVTPKKAERKSKLPHNKYGEIYELENDDRQKIHEDEIHDDKMLYENVQLRKPNNVYANVLMTTTTIQQLDANKQNSKEVLIINNKKSEELKPKITTEKLEKIKKKNNTSHNFSVKELANKFESSSTSEQQLHNVGIVKKYTNNNNDDNDYDYDYDDDKNKKIVKSIKLKKKLQSNKPITRSLDEDDFEREFCAKHRQEVGSGGGGGGLSCSSVMELPEEIMEATCQRRKSFDFTRPKALNPPKRLPGMLNTNRSAMEHKFEEILLEPSENAENHKYGYNSLNSDVSVQLTGLNSPSLDLNNPSLLSGVKLDRERIDRIKEERRQQLTEKYALKSRSKTELNSNIFNNNEILRTRSKSRGDINQMVEDHNLHYLSSPDIGNKVLQNRKSLKQNLQIAQNFTTNLNLESSDKNTKAIEKETPTIILKSNKIDMLKEKRFKRLDLKSDNNASIKDNTPKSRNFVVNTDINTCEQISPQFSIRDVTAMFESKSQIQH